MLDHLLDDGRLVFEGISGTSAGALNAVMVADGLARGGRDEALKRLADFWRAVSIDGSLPLLQRKVVEQLVVHSARRHADAGLARHGPEYFSPYDFNPLNINPLEDLFERFVDFEAVRAFSELQLFISATNVLTGRLRIFSREKITAEAVMASACLPRCSAPSRSTACLIGTAAISPIR